MSDSGSTVYSVVQGSAKCRDEQEQGEAACYRWNTYQGGVPVHDGVNQLLARSSRQGVKYYRSSYREEVTVGGLSQVREAG